MPELRQVTSLKFYRSIVLGNKVYSVLEGKRELELKAE